MRKYVCVLFFHLAAVALRAADPVAEIKSLGAFQEIDLAQLAGGQIITSCNSSMKFDRGISSQACYVAHAPLAATAELLQTWDQSKHPELDVFQHHSFHDEADAAFDMLRLGAKNAPVKKLIDATLAAKPGKTDLLITRAEAAHVPKNGDAVRQFWADVLKTRFVNFQKGGLAALPVHDAGSEKISIRSEIESLLREEPKAAHRFDSLLRDLQASPPGAAASFYWDVSSVDGSGAVDFGAVYAKDSGDHWQLAVADLYVSDGYLTSVTLYELWPVKTGGKDATLVWEISIVSSPELAGGFGVKRKIASAMIQRDMKKSAALFQQDAAKAH
jgi:hypothetical protein